MSEKEFDARLPHLNRAGWAPDKAWVPTEKQQADPEWAIQLEAIGPVDAAERIKLHLAETVPGLSYEPPDPKFRLKAIYENIKFFKSKADYESRSTDAIVGEIVAWVDYFRQSSKKPKIEDALEREAVALLKSTAEHTERSADNPELETLAVRWAAIQHAIHHFDAKWEEGVNTDEVVETAVKAGIPAEEFDILITIPISPMSLQLLRNGTESEIVRANRNVIESNMLELAENRGLIPSFRHPYAIFQHEYL